MSGFLKAANPGDRRPVANDKRQCPAEELSALKSAAVDSNKIWKAAGKPKQGPIFAKRQASKASYRKAIRDKKKQYNGVHQRTA